MTQLSPEEIAHAQHALEGIAVRTPTLKLHSERWRETLPAISGGAIKLELFQQVGSFKARGAYLGIKALNDAQRQAGVVAASGGNHALAVAWAARKLNVQAEIAIPKTADPVRINGCKDMGAKVILCEHIADAFQVMETRVSQDGLTMIHPFEGKNMTLGSATCGAEFIAQEPDLDVFIVPVGGGGLIGGLAAAVKLAKPSARVIGVEPFGADSMFQSFKQGKPVRIDNIDTIADSLASPTAMPFSYGVAKQYVDEVVRVGDDELLNAMRIYQHVLGLMIEPACAASLAAALGPLKEVIQGRNVGLIACGSNMGMPRYQELMKGL